MKKKVKQISAIIAIILLVGLYVATFIFALIDSPNSGGMFQACLFATIGIPILLWIWLWLYDVTTKKNEDSHVFPPDQEEEQ